MIAAFNAASQMLAFNDNNLTYDANGNLIENRGENGTMTYTWDARNRLIAINAPHLAAQFGYDALGRRIKKTINGRTIQYQYDGLNNILAEIEDGVISATYTTGLTIDEVFTRTDVNGVVYYQTDGLGSTITLTDQNGVPRTAYSYEPFGNTVILGELSDNPFQFTGRENDGTGLYYFRFRYYSPELQRFISEDPLGWSSGDANYFAYAHNNPLNFIDPYGLNEQSPKKNCWKIYWEQVERNRVPGAELFGLPTGLLSAGLTALLNFGPKYAEKASQYMATGAFESQRLTSHGFYLKNFRPSYFPVGGFFRALGVASLIVSAFYIPADMTTLIYTWITYDCE